MHQVETHHQLPHHLDHHPSLLILTLTLILAVTTGANQPSTEDSWLRLDRATPTLAILAQAQAHQVQAHQALIQAHHQALIQVTAQTLNFHHHPLQEKMAPLAQHQNHVSNLLALLLLKMMDNNTQALIMITVVQDSENYWPRLDLATIQVTPQTLIFHHHLLQVMMAHTPTMQRKFQQVPLLSHNNHLLTLTNNNKVQDSED